MTAEKKEIAVGGQAVIEGVMMRGPKHIATAIRRKDGSIEVKKEEFISVTKQNKFLGFPFIRGFVSLIEMLKIGFSSLSFSADRATLDLEEEEQVRAKGEDKSGKPDTDSNPQKQKKEPSPAKEKLMTGFSFAIAIALAFLLFAYLPYQTADWVKLGKNSVTFNLFTGAIRIVFFVVYLLLVSLMKDMKRIFSYHGAEHKSVFAYENNELLTVENIQKYTTLHPRCGTSFMFFVLIISILIFSIVDALVALWLGSSPVFLVRLFYHLLMLPVISGISYEILKLSGKKIDNLLVKILTFPGISLQRITTKKPDDDQIEVAVVALKAALELDLSDREVIWIE